jgi:FkbM family methyltransferase
MRTAEHEHALELVERGEDQEALRVLRDAVRRSVDPEALNDLAVLSLRDGDSAEGADLLRALTRLHPEHSAAVENLAAAEQLAPVTPASADPVPGTAAAADSDRRARFLQVVADGMATHLADNIDYLFHPWGTELPDPDAAGSRIAAELEILDRADTLWEGLGDADSRDLWLRFLAYRALGPAHVRLQLDPLEYRRAVIGLSAQALQQAAAVHFPGLPLEWQLHLYDLTALGLPIRVLGPPLPLASTLSFSQYAYRDTAIPARPHPGDVALDVGGCWGETALWLAHVIGPTGRVHTFEPSPSNRRLLEQNLGLNPSLAERTTVWGDPVAPRAGETLWIPDVVAAGATVQDELRADEQRQMVKLQTTSVDALCASGQIDRVDFLKVDVEGADLGVLQGAANTIHTHRPRLALACYHKPDDLVQIPDFIASLGVEYRWYLQCSTMTDVDTVAFGVPVDPGA